MQYNKDEVTPPSFLNHDFFVMVLSKAENDKDLTITELEMKPGTKPGDHFASIMFKAIVSYKTRGTEVLGRSLVVKTVPIEEGLKKDFLTEMPIFTRETDMYTKVLPEMKRIMESIGDDEELAPRLIYHSSDPVVLIFEDISKFGYEMQYDFYNFENTMKIVKKLAKYHALSFFMNDNKYGNKIDFTEYKHVMKDEMIEQMKVFFDGFRYLKDDIKTWPGYEEIGEKIGALEKTFTKNLFKVYEPNPEPGFNVLCHGDFHIRNMMFIKNKDDLEKTMFLDFQICFWGSPAVDLIYILYSIGDTDTRKRRGEMLRIYHEALTEYLNRLGCLKKPPSLLQLNIEMLQRGPMEVFWSTCIFPFFCMDFSKVDMETVFTPSEDNMLEMRKAMYKNQRTVNLLKEVLPDLLYKGILD
uniref:Putative ecdysteroid kinase n=2 Tax=Lutzomyia longipalpis TaxID=7200 RepID=A0A7G3AJI2_LUTLO